MADFKVPVLPVRKASPNGAQSAESSHSTNSNNINNNNINSSVYDPPFWSSLPSGHNYSLEVVKDGSIQQIVELHEKPFYIFGRLPTCDVAIDNDTVSRYHAVIQFRKTGQAYLYDLGSTHGTFVNRGPPITPKTYKQLYSGDSIKFGVSSRVYVLEGGQDRPEEKQPEKQASKLTEKQAAPVTSEPTKNEPTKKTDYITPVVSKKRFDKRFDTEDDLEEDEENVSKKMSNKRKHHEDGNEDENDEEGNVSDEERDYADMQMVADYLGRDAIEGTAEDDDFYDRTSSNTSHPSSTQTYPESHETLGVKIRILNHVLGILNQNIYNLQSIIDSDSKRRNNSSLGEDDDALDAFMSGMSQTVEEEEELEKKNKLKRDFQLELQKYTGLAEKLQPTISGIKSTIVSEKKLDMLSEQFYAELMAKVEATSKKRSQSGAPPMKKLKLVEDDDEKIVSYSSMKELQQQYSNSEVREKQIVKEDSTKASQMSTNPTLPMQTPQNEHNSPIQSPQNDNNSPLQAPRNDQKQEVSIVETFENNEIPWQAPAGQIGDGKTSLNEKYGY